MHKILNKFFSIKNFLRSNIFLDKNEKKYIEFNKKKWSGHIDIENINQKKKKIILIDLFPWFPSIHFFSYIVNFLIKRFNVNVKFFFFDLYQGTGNNLRIYI